MTPAALTRGLFIDDCGFLTVLSTREREKEASDQELEWRVVSRLPTAYSCKSKCTRVLISAFRVARIKYTPNLKYTYNGGDLGERVF